VQGKLHGRIAIVYGAGSVGEGWGNGKASAVAYARAGAKVACVDVNEAAQATTDIIAGEDGEAIALKANVTSLDDVRAATEATVKPSDRSTCCTTTWASPPPAGRWSRPRSRGTVSWT
jgi:NAD(P)-dependent dehydrogenase (short-subunit alcohol dehydrogenase family)